MIIVIIFFCIVLLLRVALQLNGMELLHAVGLQDSVSLKNMRRGKKKKKKNIT